MRKLFSNRRARAGTKVGVWSLCASLVIGLAACGGNGDQCHYLALGTAVIGQTTYAGDAPNAGGAVSAAGLAAPLGGIVENAGGTVGYLADTANNRILGYTTLAFPVSGATASFVLGQGSFSSAQTGVGARSDSPFGLAGPSKVSVSDDGRLVVTDTGNNRVLIWNSLPTSNVAPDIILGQADINGSTSNLGANVPSAATLSNPTGAMLNNNLLVVVDQNNNRVLIWKAALGTLATGSAASVELGQIDNGSGSGFTTNTAGYFVSATGTQAAGVQFTVPTDVWTDGRSLVISDSGNNRVLYWSQVPIANFTDASVVIGQPSGKSTTNPGLSAQLLNNPIGVFVAGGSLYVADTGNNRITVYESSFSSTLKGYPADSVYGQQDFNHGSYNDDDQNSQPGNQEDGQSNTNATQNTLHSPSGVFVDNTGHVLISDRGNNRILQYAVNTSVNGTNPNAYGSDNCFGYTKINPF